MYPTVCTLMGLWHFVIAVGVTWWDSTQETAAFLDTITLTKLGDRNCWLELTTLVQIDCDSDLVPIRANYGGDQQSTIGLNHLSGAKIWITLADCIASKLLTGKTARVIRAITFEPHGLQADLKPIEICGNPSYRIDPYVDDLYCRLIDLRSAIKTSLKTAATAERASLESTQLTLKIFANAASYGNFVELNVEDLTKPQQRTCYGGAGDPFPIKTDKSEEPGRYFHPLIGTLITGAARLMLAITERLILDSGLDWAFCDTDSMAIAKPNCMDDTTFYAKVETIRSWFNGLNPYADKTPLLKLEDENYRFENGRLTNEVEPLYCFAVSAKRYALFNLTGDGQIVIRKASAHGLGHLLPPYTVSDALQSIPAPAIALDKIGVERWQYDLWHQIIRAALDGHPDQVDLGYHPKLDGPAGSRYGATTPALLGWFDGYNADRVYGDRIRPSNFLLAFQIDPVAIHEFPELLVGEANDRTSRARPIKWPKPVAPYSADPNTAADHCFDRDTGVEIPAGALKTYRTAIARYHLRPEHKFFNGNYTDRGITKRRHVIPVAIRQIGKESNRWEEQFHLGSDESADIDYGQSPESAFDSLKRLRAQIIALGQRKVSRESGVSRRTIERLVKGDKIRKSVLARILRVMRTP